ncbi:MAG: triose-phosphate isomerase [Clostridia bacterium]|nr:triose-phosphate isomerase [Clostridia bacterium]
MNRSLRRPIIAGNWKMNKNPEETKQFIEAIKPKVEGANCEVVICAPYINIDAALRQAEGSNIKIGAENCHWEENGAFTGEISAKTLNDINVEYVILGHSERRLYFGETDVSVGQRVHTALHNNLKIILCVGEQLQGREHGITEEIVRIQLKEGLLNVPREFMKQIIIAYEPVWAIGTGKTATSNQAQEVCKMIRETIKELYDEDISNHIAILYGGSMNAKNADELLSMPDVDGGLIGGAALDPKSFAALVNIASNKF